MDGFTRAQVKRLVSDRNAGVVSADQMHFDPVLTGSKLPMVEPGKNTMRRPWGTEVLKDYPELQTYNRVTLRESIESVRLALWDENKRKLVSFREASVG